MDRDSPSSALAKTSAFTAARSKSLTDSSTASAPSVSSTRPSPSPPSWRGLRSFAHRHAPRRRIPVHGLIGCAFNQISNMVAKTHYLWARPPARPARTQRRIRPRRAVPLAESRMWFVHNPGLKVICRHAYDARPDQSRHPRQQSLYLLRTQISLRRIKGEVPQKIT